MITIDVTMFIQIINMLLLIVILNAVLYKPIRNMLEQRKKKLAGLDGDVSNFKKNAQLHLEEFDRKIMAARSNGKSEYENARNAATSQNNEKLAGIRKEVDAQKTEQISQIAKEFAAAQSQLQGQIDGFARDMAAKVLGRAL